MEDVAVLIVVGMVLSGYCAVRLTGTRRFMHGMLLLPGLVLKAAQLVAVVIAQALVVFARVVSPVIAAVGSVVLAAPYFVGLGVDKVVERLPKRTPKPAERPAARVLTPEQAERIEAYRQRHRERMERMLAEAAVALEQARGERKG